MENKKVVPTRPFFYQTPIGWIKLVVEKNELVRLDFVAKLKQQNPQLSKALTLKSAVKQLGAYFAGKLRDFNLPLSPIAQLPGTPFQKSVWKAIARIPYGKTKSYLDIARSIGNPRSVRAVANACGANPIAIIIPCHRVTGTGWHGGGIKKKKFLLKLEKIIS